MTGSIYGVAQQQRDADVEEGEFGAGRRAQAREAVGGGESRGAWAPHTGSPGASQMLLPAPGSRGRR